MTIPEIIMVCVGLSLDVFAVVVCYGAVLLKIERSRLIKMCIIYSIWQSMAVYAGRLITYIPGIMNVVGGIRAFAEIFTVLIFSVLGAFMIYKDKKKDNFVERLSDVTYKEVLITACITCIDAVLAGMGFGFMNANIFYVMLSMLIITALVVIIALYVGYRMGEQKTFAYFCGGILFFISAVSVIIEYYI